MLNVVPSLSTQNKTWEFLSQKASPKEFLEFFENVNVHDKKKVPNFEDISWRLRDKEFYRKIVEILQHRRKFTPVVWSFSLIHEDVKTAKEYLESTQVFSSEISPPFSSELLEIRDSDQFHVFEYFPFVNTRAHKFPDTKELGKNPPFLESKYLEFLRAMSLKPKMDSSDRLIFCYYLILQEKIETARLEFQKISISDAFRLQYDYFDAYLDFFNENPKKALEIAEKYKNYPVYSWRQKFLAILDQISEISGNSSVSYNLSDRNSILSANSNMESSFDFFIAEKSVKISYKNSSEIVVGFFHMDIEVLFSKNPFSMETAFENISSVSPNEKIFRKIPSENFSNGICEIPIPVHIQHVTSAICVYVDGLQQKKTKMYFPNELSVQISENSGEIKVLSMNSRKGIPKAYVKIYSRKKSQNHVEFYKDGYTDLRGKFDYVSNSFGRLLSEISDFAILVATENHGTFTRVAKAPKT